MGTRNFILLIFLFLLVALGSPGLLLGETPLSYDVTGRTVATVVDAYRGAGELNVQWTGTDDSGVDLPAGIYRVSVRSPDGSAEGNLVILR